MTRDPPLIFGYVGAMVDMQISEGTGVILAGARSDGVKTVENSGMVALTELYF